MGDRSEDNEPRKKRVADRQGRKGEESDSDMGEEPSGEFERAPESVIATRKIAVPRSRLAARAATTAVAPSEPSVSAPSSNPFANVGLASAPAPNPFATVSFGAPTTTAPANPFAGVTLLSMPNAPPLNSFGFPDVPAPTFNAPPPPPAVNSPATPVEDNKAASAAETPVKASSETKEATPAKDVTPVNTTTPQAEEKKEEEKKEPATTTFTFPTAPPVFNFGSVPSAPAPSSNAQTGGVQFGTTPASTGFSFPASSGVPAFTFPTSSVPAAPTTGGFTFGGPVASVTPAASNEGGIGDVFAKIAAKNAVPASGWRCPCCEEQNGDTDATCKMCMIPRPPVKA